MTQKVYLRKSILVLWVLCLLSAMFVVILTHYYRISTNHYISLQIKYHKAINYKQLLKMQYFAALSYIELGNIAIKYELEPPEPNKVIIVYVD